MLARLVVIAVVVIAAVVAVVLAVVLRPATGIPAALEDDDFGSCLGREGAPEDEPILPDGSSASERDSRSGPVTASGDQEVEFWSHPLALHCAGVALGEDRRVRALSIAFPSLDGDGAVDVTEQWQPIADYAAWLADDDVPRDIAMLRLTGVLRGLWVAHSAESNWADGFTGTAVLADMRARDELPGFAAWFDEHGSEYEGADDTGVAARALFTYRADVLGKVGADTESAYHEYSERSRTMYEVVR
jgi:hypothetical protein